MRSRIQAIIESSTDYPQLPPICHSIADAVENPESSFEDIARIVEGDSAVSIRLLRLANSLFYNYPIEVTTVPDALSVIGLQQIKNLSLALTLPAQSEKQEALPFSHRLFWRNSIAAGLCARTIALELREANTERHFIAGFLHKVGRIFLAAVFPKQSKTIHERAQEQDVHRNAIEQSVLGFDSNEFAAAILEKWQLPANVIELVRHNAKPVLARRNTRGVSIVHIASFIVASLGLGETGDRFVPDFSEAAWGYTGLDESRIYFVVEELLRQYEAVCHVFLDPA